MTSLVNETFKLQTYSTQKYCTICLFIAICTVADAVPETVFIIYSFIFFFFFLLSFMFVANKISWMSKLIGTKQFWQLCHHLMHAFRDIPLDYKTDKYVEIDFQS